MARYVLVNVDRVPLRGNDTPTLEADSVAMASAMAAMRKGAYVLDRADGHIVRFGLPGLAKCTALAVKRGDA